MHRSTASAALYQQNLRPGIRTGISVQDGKMNGLHGPKHRRDMDRECKLFCSLDMGLLSIVLNNFSQSFHRDPPGGPSGRNCYTLQRPTWLSIPTEEA